MGRDGESCGEWGGMGRVVVSGRDGRVMVGGEGMGRVM